MTTSFLLDVMGGLSTTASSGSPTCSSNDSEKTLLQIWNFIRRDNHEIMRMNEKEFGPSLGLKAGELVEVKSKEEILATLDSEGCLEGLPFMPEMFRYCGSRLQVYKRAHKGFDTVFSYRSRGMTNAVHLETRCTGEAHGGCQADCLIYWKEAWLKRSSAGSHNGNGSSPARARSQQTEVTP